VFLKELPIKGSSGIPEKSWKLVESTDKDTPNLSQNIPRFRAHALPEELERSRNCLKRVSLKTSLHHRKTK
jgi:hypothetical protein